LAGGHALGQPGMARIIIVDDWRDRCVDLASERRGQRLFYAAGTRRDRRTEAVIAASHIEQGQFGQILATAA
jgi:hypothetical protein